MHAALSLFIGALGASAALIPVNSTDPVNATIPFYSDPVLQAVAANPPANLTQASVTFTNGARNLTGAYFNFTEYPGINDGNHTVVEISFAFPNNLSSTNNVFAYHIHDKPIAWDDQACTSAGGHYDPLLANGTQGLTTGEGGLYHPNPANLSTFQLGDLAGRWGALSSINGVVSQRIILDNYVRLTGNFSVVGRSVVIHDAPTNKRIACGNITVATFTPSASADTNSSSANSSSSNDNKSGAVAVGLSKAMTSAGLMAAVTALLAALL